MTGKRPDPLPFGFPPKVPVKIQDKVCSCGNFRDEWDKFKSMFVCKKCRKPSKYNVMYVYECVWCGEWYVHSKYIKSLFHSQSCANCAGLDLAA